MLAPWQIKTERQREQLLAALPAFRGGALIWRGQAIPGVGTPGTPLQPLDDTQRDEVAQRVRSEIDPHRDVWIASGKLESSSAISTLLHATLDEGGSATVDLLLSVAARNNPLTSAYDGFGEFVALTLVLERLGAPRFSIPIALDTHATGLTSAGWAERQPGVYVFTRAPVAN